VYEGVIQSLIDELGRLPGVGPKGAQRIAFYLLGTDPADVRRALGPVEASVTGAPATLEERFFELTLASSRTRAPA